MDLQGRLRAVIVENTPERGRFSALERKTGIGAETWKAVWYGRQRPPAPMIEAVCKMWPQFAFWLATGISEVAHGHLPPASYRANQMLPVAKPAAAKHWAAVTALKLACEQNGLESDLIPVELIGNVIPRRLVDEVELTRKMFLEEVEHYSKRPELNWIEQDDGRVYEEFDAALLGAVPDFRVQK